MGKLFEKIKKYFRKENLLALQQLPKVLNKKEKIVLGILVGAIVVSGFFIWRGQWLENTKEVPAIGGTYIEGVVGEAKDLNRHIARLTGIGLTRLVENGNVQGDAAESWEIIDNGKTYQFKLRPNFNSYDLADAIENKNAWPSTEIATPDEQTLQIKFKQPFSPFLYISTEPIFPYGPYKIIREEKNQITLQAQNQYWRGKPRISKIIIRLYPTKDALEKAVNRNEVMGFLSLEKQEKKDFTAHELALPREAELFFNLSKQDLQSIQDRRDLRDGKELKSERNLVLVTSDTPKNMQMAEDLKNKWKELKVNLEIKKYNNIELQKDIIPKREYDLLLYGLDYGPDPDPYPFWHSSQIKDGMNLSNFSNKQADKLLEEARQTYDFKIREDKYTAFRKILDSEVPYITLSQEVFNYSVSNKVKGISKIFGFAETDRFLNIDDWYIQVGRVKK